MKNRADMNVSEDEFRDALDAIADQDFSTSLNRLEKVIHTLTHENNTLARMQQLVRYGLSLQVHCETFLLDRHSPPVVLTLDEQGNPSGNKPLPDPLSRSCMTPN
ncbi:MAG: hypothetical protein OXC91_05500 [Rhodobacteraceae bacterium]|nr:hypothetical protein [Paracoccaceae bacterium]